MILPAISLWQPWASLIFTGDKMHETRAYPPPAKYVGKRIAIHAAKHVERPVGTGMMFLCEREFGSEGAPGAGVRNLPRGVILGTIMLVGFGRTEETDSLTTANRIAGGWSPGRFAWRLADPQALPEPVPWKGKQGWFQVELPEASPQFTMPPKQVQRSHRRLP